MINGWRSIAWSRTVSLRSGVCETKQHSQAQEILLEIWKFPLILWKMLRWTDTSCQLLLANNISLSVGKNVVKNVPAVLRAVLRMSMARAKVRVEHPKLVQLIFFLRCNPYMSRIFFVRYQICIVTIFEKNYKTNTYWHNSESHLEGVRAKVPPSPILRWHWLYY